MSTVVRYLSLSRIHRPRANVIQTINMTHAFRVNGADVQLWVPPWKNPSATKQRLTNLGVADDLPVKARRLFHSRWRPWGLKVFVRLHKRALSKADIVYVRSAKLSRILAKYAIPHAFEIHEIHDLEEEGAITDFIHWHQMGLIKALIPISDAIRQRLIQAGANGERIFVAPSATNLDLFQSVPAWDKGNLDNPRLCYIGRVSRDRGLDIFLELARRKVGEVTLVGPLDDDQPLPREVNYEGAVDYIDVPSWYSKTDLVLLPYQDNLRHANSISPMKLFEAMAVGRPIIASDLPAIREIIRHGENGLLVPPDDIEAWQSAIKQLQMDRELAQGLANKAREDSHCYDWKGRASIILENLGYKRHGFLGKE